MRGHESYKLLSVAFSPVLQELNKALVDPYVIDGAVRSTERYVYVCQRMFLKNKPRINSTYCIAPECQCLVHTSKFCMILIVKAVEKQTYTLLDGICPWRSLCTLGRRPDH